MKILEFLPVKNQNQCVKFFSKVPVKMPKCPWKYLKKCAWKTFLPVKKMKKRQKNRFTHTFYFHGEKKNTASYPRACEWMSEWSEWKWSVFGPLFFLELIYIIDHIYTFIATRGNCAQQLSYGCKILDKLGVAEKNFKIWLLGWFFQKWSPTCRS